MPKKDTLISNLLAAAQKDEVAAQCNLGLRYLFGDGVEQDDETAGFWIARAAKQNHPEALGELGNFYRFGRGVEPDLVTSCELHMLAARLGDVNSHGSLSDYRDELEKLALDGNRQVAFALCHMFDWGIGVEPSPALTWAWLRWAHDGCDPLPDDDPCASDINADVVEAFRFFRCGVLDKNVIDEGEAHLGQWLFEAGHAGIGIFRPILSVRAVGGSVVLNGRWNPGGAWQFVREVHDWTPELIDEPVISHLSPLADSWRGALKLMDKYSWHRFAPSEVHPEFAERVWRAYQRRWDKTDREEEHYRDRWQKICGNTRDTDDVDEGGRS